MQYRPVQLFSTGTTSATCRLYGDPAISCALILLRFATVCGRSNTYLPFAFSRNASPVLQQRQQSVCQHQLDSPVHGHAAIKPIVRAFVHVTPIDGDV